MIDVKLTALAALYAVGVVGYNTDDQINPDIPFGTFENPSSNVRPRFRYFLQDCGIIGYTI